MADYLHHDPDRVLFTLSEEELNNISNPVHSLWKDFCLVAFSVGIPSVINAVTEITNQKEFKLDLTLFLNSLLGTLGIILGGVFAIMWHRSHGDSEKMIEKIKAKPKMQLPTTSDVGALNDLKESVEALKNKPATWG